MITETSGIPCINRKYGIEVFRYDEGCLKDGATHPPAQYEYS